MFEPIGSWTMKYKITCLAATLACHFCICAFARTLPVGPGKLYSVPSAVLANVQDGDTVLIEPGLYQGDVASWTKNNLVLKGTAKFAHLDAGGKSAEGKAIWVISGKNTVVENIEFSGATVPDQNGAGIRQQGDNLTVRHCYFHGNEDGILGGGGTASEVMIEYSEFASNGFGDGQSHNIYISNVKSFTLRFCYSHEARIGHEVKSRANANYLLYNRILDGLNGTASYSVDLPNGGTSFLIGNVFQQSPLSDNSTLVSYGAEGLTNSPNDLFIYNNTFVNDMTGGNFIRVATGTRNAKFGNNLFVGHGTMYTGTADTTNNLLLPSADPGFANRTAFDYHILSTSPAIDKGKAFDSAQGFSLVPTFEFFSLGAGKPRAVHGLLDLGAFEFDSGSPILMENKNGTHRKKAASQLHNNRRSDITHSPVFAFGTKPGTKLDSDPNVMTNGLGRISP